MGRSPPVMMDLSDSRAPTTLSRVSEIIEILRKALFGVIYVMSKETSSNTLIIVSGSFLQFFQILAFAFNKDRAFSLNEAAAAPLLKALPYSTLAGWQSSNVPQKGGFTFVAAFTTVVIVLGCAVYVGYAFVQNSFKIMWPLKVF
jgi:hypothetical protein